ncbi:hypothetical protein [Streptomyces sp. NPDC088400]|uniref:hypothetical protein n=1 Tax=Streptomyces sp. NPDC088400 TaxID=3365861 RepID=UPI0037F7093D
MTLKSVAGFPVVCMPHRLRTAKTYLELKFTPNQASCFLRITDVMPLTKAPLAPSVSPFYRADVSSRYISTIEESLTAEEAMDEQALGHP